MAETDKNAGVRIVLAEDHALVRAGLHMLLSAEPGLTVVAETGDGSAVEALVRQTSPELLILDLHLPGRHGIDIAAAVKGEFGAAVKVLVLTGDLEAAAVNGSLAAGADAYVHKSEESGELLAAVRAVIAGRRFVSASIAAVFHPAAAPRQADAGPIAATPRERQIMSLVARGLANREIAGVLGISVLTVRTHRQNLMEKFNLRNAAEITAYAVQQGYYHPG